MARVLSIVSYPFLPARVGGQKFVALFHKYFCRYHPVVCVTTRDNDPSAAEGYTVLNVLSDSPWRYINPFYFFTLRRLIRSHQITHLLLEHPYYGWLGWLLARACRLPLVIHSHNIEGLRWKSLGKWWWRILWRYEKWTHRRADHNLFIQQEDMQYAISHFGLNPSACIVMPYGFEKGAPPDTASVRQSREQVRKDHGIAADEAILLFNGSFDYSPNRVALEHLLYHINPILQQGAWFRYRILICGRNIPGDLTREDHPAVVWAGYVKDIDVYFRGADVFLNPVTRGGGMKTKLVEALGNNLTSVSARSGAVGIDPAWCGGKLLIAEDDDWAGFAGLIVQALAVKVDIPAVYFEHFYWGHIIRKAAEFIGG